MARWQMRNQRVGDAGGGRPWSRWLPMLVLALGVIGLSGCLGDDGSRGAQGEQGEEGPTGAPGTDGSPGTLGQVRPSVTITDAYIQDDRPVVEFEIAAQLPSGMGLTFDPPPGDVEFTVARLVDKDGYETWQSYLTTSSDGPRTGDHVRLQADQVRGNHPDGVWESLGGNAYRYTYPVDVTAVPAEYQNAVDPVTADDWVDASQIDMRRFVVLLRPGSFWDAAYDHMDAGMGETKRSVATATCNSCHDQVVAHGNNRIGVETCSTCHNQFSFSSFTDEANAVDLAYLGHEIHSGGGLASTEQFLRPRWTDVAFPRDIATCVSCHNPDPDHAGDGAQRAFANPTIETCGSCHDNVNFETGDGHAAGARENISCANCHSPGGGLGADVRHVDPARQFARDGDLRYVIESADLVGDELSLTWGVMVDDQRVVDDEDGWSFGTTLRVGWFDTDFTHSDPGSTRPGSPVEVGNAHDGNHQGGGTYVTTVDLNGMGYDGSNLYVTLGGNIANADHGALVAANAFHFMDESRREVVSNATCTTCHEDRFGVFNKHGGNRHNNVQQCVVCHNNNSTDIARRSQDGRAEPPVGSLAEVPELPTNFMVMVHKLHSADNAYALPGFPATGWSYWGDLRYPAPIANCTQCHVGDSFYPVARTLEPRGTTVDSQDGSSNVDAHWKVSAAMAACSSCHTSSDAEAHMLLNGSVAGASWDQPAIDSSSYETCSTCHGPGRTADVRKVHGLPE